MRVRYLLALIMLCLLARVGVWADPPLNRFEAAIRTFEGSDNRKPLAPEGTLFVGSSTFARWTSLERTFHDLGAINRGFGGSTIPEVTHYVDRVVVPYAPRQIVFYAGTNDIADGHSAARVAADFQKFVERVRQDLPEVPIYFISISMAPSRTQWASQYEEANRLIEKYIETHSRLKFIDVRPVMVDAQGRLRTELFGPDHLHMTEQGYALWTPIIRKALESSP